MIAPLILPVVAWAMISCATRLKHIPALGFVPRNMTGFMPQPRMIHTRVNLPHPQMILAARPDDGVPNDDLPKWRFNSNGDIVPIRRWTLRTSPQTWPPTTIDGIDAKHILHNWAELLMLETAEVGLLPPPGTPGYQQADKLSVLHIMRYDVADEEGSFRHSDLEMVGLIEKGLEIPSGESRSSAVAASVLAVGMFSRDTLKDDHRGSLRKKVEEQYGKRWARRWWGRAKTQFDVFLVGGIADAPYLPERSVRALLSKIQEYAHQEQRIVMVPKTAYASSYGAYDLTDYYVHLGFEKVYMEGGSHELVFAATPCSAEDMWVGNRQLMVGIKLWT